MGHQSNAHAGFAPHRFHHARGEVRGRLRVKPSPLKEYLGGQ